MKEEIQKDAGWVSLETLTKFNRLKELSTDHKVIVEALKKSQAQLLEIDEVGAKVRRAKALPDNLGEFETNLKQNTVYVKGFPTTMVLDDLYPFFEKHGKVLQVFMRRFPTTKQFKVNIYIYKLSCMKYHASVAKVFSKRIQYIFMTLTLCQIDS